MVNISFWFMLMMLIYWRGSVRTIKENTEALVADSKDTGLEVNVDRTKCTVTSPDQNAGRSHNLKTDSFERVEGFIYLGTNLKNRNSIQEEIKSTVRSGYACYHLVQNVLSSSLLFKNSKIKIYRNTILPIVLYGCET